MDGAEQIGGAGEILQRQFERPSRMAASYAELLIAWSKMVGFEVNPVTENSAM